MLLEEFLKPLEISRSHFAARLGISVDILNEIISGKRGVTPEIALRLAQALGIPADFWLGLQQDWDYWNAARLLHHDSRLEPSCGHDIAYAANARV